MSTGVEEVSTQGSGGECVGEVSNHGRGGEHPGEGSVGGREGSTGGGGRGVLRVEENEAMREARHVVRSQSEAAACCIFGCKST